MSRHLAPLLIALACTPSCNFEPDNEEVYSPPAVYRVWFEEMASCARRRADFDRITWIAADLTGLAGHREGYRIWIDRDYLDARWVVAHEQMHVLLNGDSQHQRPEWHRCLG